MEHLCIGWKHAAIGVGLSMMGCAAAPSVEGASAALESAIGPEVVVRVGPVSGDGMYPDIACTSTTCLVAWQELDSSAEGVYAARVRASDGALLDAEPILIQAQTDPTDISVAASADRFLVTWSHYFSVLPIRSALVDESGAVFDTGLDDCDEIRSAPNVTSDGESFLMVSQLPTSEDCGPWSCTDIHEIYATKIEADGSSAEPCGRRITTDFDNDSDPIVAWGGSEYLTFWNSGSGSNVARLSEDGELLERWTQSYADRHAAVAGDGYGYMLLWSDGDKLLGSRLDEAGDEVSTTELVDLEFDDALYGGRIAFDGSSFLAIWADGPGGAQVLHAARFSTDGSEIEPSVVVTNGVGTASVASAGDGLAFVAYEPQRQIATPNRVIVRALHAVEEPDPGVGGGAGGGTGGSLGGCSGDPSTPMTCSGASGGTPGEAAGWMLIAAGAWIVRRRGRRAGASPT